MAVVLFDGSTGPVAVVIGTGKAQVPQFPWPAGQGSTVPYNEPGGPAAVACSGSLSLRRLTESATAAETVTCSGSLSLRRLQESAATGFVSIPIASSDTGSGVDVGAFPFSSLTDNFSVNDLAASWSGSLGTYTWSSGQVALLANAGASSYLLLNSGSKYTLTGSSVYMRAMPWLGSSTGVSMLVVYVGGTNNALAIVYSGGYIYCYYEVNGTITYIGSPFSYNASLHAYWRIRESGGTIFYDTSPDSVNWTTQETTPDPGFSLAVMRTYFEVSDTGGGTGYAFVLSVNAPALSLMGPCSDSGTGTETAAVTPLFTCSGSLALRRLTDSGTGAETVVSCSGSLALRRLTESAGAAEGFSSAGSLTLRTLQESGAATGVLLCSGSLTLRTLQTPGLASDIYTATGSLALQLLTEAAGGSALLPVNGVGSAQLVTLAVAVTLKEYALATPSAQGMAGVQFNPGLVIVN